MSSQGLRQIRCPGPDRTLSWLLNSDHTAAIQMSVKVGQALHINGNEGEGKIL